MIEIFKITHETVSHHIPSYARANTRGNNYELVNHSFIMTYPSIFSLHVLLILGTVCLIQ